MTRNWTTSITSAPFEEYLFYNTSHNGNTLQWAGNISAMDWKTGNNTQQSLPEGYTFLYDALSRLTAADYHLNDTRSNNYDTRYTYDSMGNILTLKRRGLKALSSNTLEGGDIYALIDDITFDYYGNQITKATDAVSDGPYYQGAWHYRDRTDADEERTYDANGNLISDSDANISSIQYNSLNLSLMKLGCGSEKSKQVWYFAHLALTLSDSDSVH